MDIQLIQFIYTLLLAVYDIVFMMKLNIHCRILFSHHLRNLMFLRKYSRCKHVSWKRQFRHKLIGCKDLNCLSPIAIYSGNLRWTEQSLYYSIFYSISSFASIIMVLWSFRLCYFYFFALLWLRDHPKNYLIYNLNLDFLSKT